MKQDIVIYNDDGVGAFGLLCLQKFFGRLGHDVWLCDSRAVVEGAVFGMADLFVMPGGADLPYCEKLNGPGNDNIRAFVEDGGTYLGICAGAYYACKAIEYHKGREDEICQPRQLALIDAVAKGSLHSLAKPYDLTLQSAAIADLVLADGKTAQAFYHGGCTFDINKNQEADIIARYADPDGQPPCIVRADVGNGTALLSGVHFEMPPDLLCDHPGRDQDREKLGEMLRTFINPYDGAALFEECKTGLSREG